MRATILLSVPLVLAAGVALADNAEPSRVAVNVKGQASAIADTVEVEFTVTARAEESVGAEKKFRSKLAEVLSALKEGKAAAKPAKKHDEKAPDAAPRKKSSDDDDDDAPKKAPAPRADAPAEDAPAIPVEVAERGLTFGVKAAKDDSSNPFKAIARMQGQGAPATDPPMQFSTKVVVAIKGVKKLDPKQIARRVSQLIDVGIDAGADGTDNGQAPVIHFLVDDNETLRNAAYEDAMKKATARATKLATLGGRQLGPAVSIREGTAGAKAEDIQMASMKAVQNMFGSSAETAPTGFEVSVEVELGVDFGLVSDKKVDH